MSKKRVFDLDVEGFGEVTIEVKQSVLDEILGEDWQSFFYTFHNETEVVKWLAWALIEWPPDYKGKHCVDGLADKTTDDIVIISENLNYSWDDLFITVSEQGK